MFRVLLAHHQGAHNCIKQMLDIILNSVCKYNYFITQGNYIGYMFRL